MGKADKEEKEEDETSDAMNKGGWAKQKTGRRKRKMILVMS